MKMDHTVILHFSLKTAQHTEVWHMVRGAFCIKMNGDATPKRTLRPVIL
jgi:hypothetical protein